MGEESKIEWCDHSWNGWEGCTKVSAGCAHCYAEARDKRFEGGKHWGRGAPRRRTSEANWKLPLRWQRKAEKTGIRPRVFCNSLSDWLDEEVPIEWFADLLDQISKTPNFDRLLLTKRPENFMNRMAEAKHYAQCKRDSILGLYIFRWMYGEDVPENVWIGTTVENQEMANKRIPELLEIPTKVRFLSCEPLLDPVDLTHIRIGNDQWFPMQHINWVICGGESGSRARPMHPDWARSLRDQCQADGVPFFFKQWGEWGPDDLSYVHASGNTPKRCWMHSNGAILDWRGPYPPDYTQMLRYGKSSSGRLLDGREWNEFPKSGGVS